MAGSRDATAILGGIDNGTGARGDTRASTGRHLPKLRLSTKAGYAAGSLLDGVATQGVSIFLFFYVTAVCGVPGALAGIALAAGLVVDAVIDPLIGSLSDGMRSRIGRRLPFMLIGLPGTMIFLILIFSLPTGLGPTALFAWLMLLSILLRISMSLFLLPYAAISAELSDDYVERSSIMVWRWGAAMIGALLAIVLGFGVFLGGPAGLARRTAYTPFAFALAAVVGVGAIVAIRSVMQARERLHPPQVDTASVGRRLISQVREIFSNQSFRTLFAGALLMFTALGINSALGLHANTYFWRLTAPQIQLVTLSLFAGLLLGAPLAGPLLKRLEKRTVLLIGMVGLGAALSIPACLRLAGLFPFAGATLAGVLAVAGFFGGCLMAAAGIAFSSMMADAADEHEYLFGARREGLYFAGWAFASKAAAGLGSLVSGIALQLIGFKSGGAGQAVATAAQLSPKTITWIGVIYGPGAGVLTLAAASTCLFYRLSSAKHASIMAALGQRRTNLTISADADGEVI